MAGEGSMMHAIKTMQNNKALLKDKRRSSWKNYLGVKNVPTVDHIKASPELLVQIRENCKKDRKKKVKENILYLVLTICTTVVIFYLLDRFLWSGIDICYYEQ